MESNSDFNSSSPASPFDSHSPLSTPASTPQTGEQPPFLGLNGTAAPPAAATPVFLEPSGDRFILVIGGLGFIGSHTALELLKTGQNVIVVDDLSNSYHGNLDIIQKLADEHCKSVGTVTPQLHFHKVNYCQDAMRLVLESYAEVATPTPDCLEFSDDENNDTAASAQYRSRIAGVIHFAAHKSTPESFENPLRYYQNNVCGLVALLELLAEYNVRNLVFSSSATVYGVKASRGGPLREHDLVHHPELYRDHHEDGGFVERVADPSIAGLTSPYARTKYFCEAILADVARADPRWRIMALRYFNPIGCDSSGLLGENPRNRPTNLFPVIAEVLTGARPELHVFGDDWDTRDGTAVRDYVHVCDVARGHVAALAAGPNLASSFRTYNLGSGTGTTVMEAVESLQNSSARKIPVKYVGRRPGDVGICIASPERAAKELGWTARESIGKCATDLWNYVCRTAVGDQNGS